MNIAVITLDSLRYDVAVGTDTPNLDAIFTAYQAGSWRRVFAQGTYTLPSHISLLQGAIAPSNFGDEPVYNRRICSFFQLALPWRTGQPALYQVEAVGNVVKGFEAKGYRTVGIGGVGWFNPSYETGALWRDRFFQEFYWAPDCGEDDARSFEHQLELARSVLGRRTERPLFFFLNVSATHSPYCGAGMSLEGQATALRYVDDNFPRLLELLPRPCHLLLWSDHGDCLGEDGMWGHGFSHEKVLEVPMVHFVAT